jgi:hypothetical protein
VLRWNWGDYKFDRDKQDFRGERLMIRRALTPESPPDDGRIQQRRKNWLRDWDPYSIKRGGLWAHILWLFYLEPPTYENVPDLQGNRLARWQFR